MTVPFGHVPFSLMTDDNNKTKPVGVGEKKWLAGNSRG